MMIRNAMMLFAAVSVFSACSKSDDNKPVIPPPSDGSKITLDGGTGGASATNTVYVDFSSNSTASVARNSWNLGFFGGNDYRVILNYNTSTAATATTKNDITKVTVDDAAAINLEIALGEGKLEYVDDATGDISKTVIAAVSATDADNKVYLIKPDGATKKEDWYKVRVVRNGNGYKLQYAKLSETTIQTADISKDAAFNFSFFSFIGAKLVVVEPKKADWDIQWGLAMYFTFNPDTNGNIPYTFSDLVFINNLAGVTAAEATEANGFKYDTFTAADVTNTKLVFSGKRDAIGSKWRTTGGPNGGATGIKRDRFYVVKDAAGNYYKLKFVSMGLGQDGGVRGKPEIEYKLVKKA
ncbi:HmuY family protein [Chitinophaga pendula]|uniref:HmuY family protein n=1 Tax=Chitinophaga TaxID=79328 RepID=UPI000BAE7AE5|nr:MULTISPECIES: HmuY family protein [Chitinophaga]ASZ09724.1 hypothetical protein CK934_01410 [Chitinophaga sp. MD30]UCJ07332.1 HmuY family protein [Chitinophaga pendula]